MKILIIKIAMIVTGAFGLSLTIGPIYSKIFLDIKFDLATELTGIGLLLITASCARLKSALEGYGNESEFIDMLLTIIFLILGVLSIALGLYFKFR